MARNGSGTYSNPYPNFVSGTVISSTEVNANNSAIATALTQSIAVDGQSTVTANLPMNSKKLTGLAAGTAAADSLNLGQAQAEAMVWCGTAGGTADAITLAPSPAITAYAAGQRFVWKASGSANTGATTVAISGLGAIALQDNGAALVAGNHAANKIFMGILDTTSTVQVMQVQIIGTNPLIVTSLTVSGTATVGGILSVDDTTDTTSGTTGSIHTDGGLGVAKNLFVATNATVSGTTLMTGVTTHGGNVVSDTDSTDDLGTTGVRWANTWTDAINGVTSPTAQYTSAEETKLAGIETAADVTDATNVLAALVGQEAVATGFTGTLDGVLGGGTPAAATVTTLNASGVTTVQAGTALLPSIVPTGDTNTGVWFPAADTVAASTAGTERMRIDSSGNVGIGTASPDLPLAVSGSIGSTGSLFLRGQSTGDQAIRVGSDRTGNGYSYIDLVGDVTYTSYGLRLIRSNTGANAASSIYHRGTGLFAIVTQEAANLFLGTANTERMRITSTGLVGIGTSSPAAKLHSSVSSSGAAATGGVNLAGFFEAATVAGIQLSSGTGSPAYLFMGDAADTDAFRIQAGDGFTQISASGASDYMRFDTGGFTECMRIDSSGNVGIGTTAPDGKLDIATGGTTDVVAALGGTFPAFTYRNGTGAWFHAGKHPSSDYFYIGRGGTPTTNVDVVVDSSGNVGIGTASPSTALEVNGTITATAIDSPGVAKAWVNFNGTGTVTINASHNVTSITDNGAGDYTINFTTAFSSAYYGFSSMSSGPSTFAIALVSSAAAPTAAAFRMRTFNTAGAGVDATYVGASFFGDQ
jgi:hypothetical protein